MEIVFAKYAHKNVLGAVALHFNNAYNVIRIRIFIIENVMNHVLKLIELKISNV